MMTELDAGHVTVEALRRLVPEVTVAGGSFSDWLPHPQVLGAADRTIRFEAARALAIKNCVHQLLHSAGLSEEPQVGRGAGGERIWPPGFVGSLTHKGTVVLGALARSTSVPTVGIDLERIDRSDLRDLEHRITPEGLPPGVDRHLGILVAFSSKEAVYKAQYPQTGQRRGFPDVRLAWGSKNGDSLRADVEGPLEWLQVRCMLLDRWVVSVALPK